MPSLFLVVSAFCLLLALNTLRPARRSMGLSVASFFAGWLVGELALHHVALQILVAVAFVWQGALAGWQGWLALSLFVLGWTLLLHHYRSGAEAGSTIDAALRDAFGEDFDDAIPPAEREVLDGRPDWRAIAKPFPIGHAEVERIRDVVYHQEGRLRLRLDVFRHKRHPARTPTLIYVHGGAWLIGSKREQGLPLLHYLASLGWTCFSIDYRLSPRATFPDHLVDVKRAIAWVRAHGAEHGADPDCLVLCGNSAGGHLASLAALTANRAALQPGFESADTRVSACVSFYGVYDLLDRHGSYAHHGFLGALERFVMKAKHDEAPEKWELASPIAHVHADAPPFLCLHGASDSLVPVAQARHFAAAFRAVAKAPIALAVLDGAQHAFEIFPSLRAEWTVRGVARFCAFIAAARAARRRTGGVASASG